MDVTPISLQMVVPRATEVSQVQQNLNQAAALQQDFEALRQKEDAKLKEKQVRHKDNPEDGRIKDNDEDHTNRQGYAGDGGQHRKQAEEDMPSDETKYAVDPSRGHHLDISL